MLPFVVSVACSTDKLVPVTLRYKGIYSAAVVVETVVWATGKTETGIYHPRHVSFFGKITDKLHLLHNLWKIIFT